MENKHINKWDSIIESLTRNRVFTVFVYSKAYHKIIILNKRTGQAMSLFRNSNGEVGLYRFYHRHELIVKRIHLDENLKVILGYISEFFNENDRIMGSNVYNNRYQKFARYSNIQQPKKIVYIDLDGVVVDLMGEFIEYKRTHPGSKKGINEWVDTTEDGFLTARPIEGSIDALERIETKYDVFILSTAPWKNLNAWTHKRIWVENYLPSMRKKLILSNNKNLLMGDYLIDDRLRNGAPEFEGEHLYMFSDKYPDWESILKKLKV